MAKKLVTFVPHDASGDMMPVPQGSKSEAKVITDNYTKTNLVTSLSSLF